MVTVIAASTSITHSETTSLGSSSKSSDSTLKAQPALVGDLFCFVFCFSSKVQKSFLLV
jgi:hypothetical protein